MKNYPKTTIAFCILFLSATLLSAQEDGGFAQQSFGFGFDDEDNGTVSSSLGTVKIGGEVSAALIGYVDDFDDAAKVNLGDIFSGKMNFSASNSNAEGIINLKLQPVFDGSSSPITIGEAYGRFYFGPLAVTGGVRKLTWGKADSMSPLDVINPLDYSDLSGMSDISDLKIARPLIHLSYNVTPFSNLEAVFVPVFEGIRFAEEGRWAPAQFAALAPPAFTLKPAKTDTLDYAQAGLRFTTTIGPADFGIQYFYGNLFQPAVTITPTSSPPPPFTTFDAVIDYNRYHQIAVDYAQVLAGFNIRTDFGANITEDTNGDDGTVYNPHLVWSLGFDRDLFAGINLNVEGVGTVRLLNDKIGDNPLLDFEADTDMTSTHIISALSKKFLRDELELEFAIIWGIEDEDALLMPSVTWTKNDVELSLRGGIFAGSESGQFGQYKDNGFIKMGITYSF